MSMQSRLQSLQCALACKIYGNGKWIKQIKKLFVRLCATALGTLAHGVFAKIFGETSKTPWAIHVA